MSSARATISKILTYSCVDGPGNRLVLFLQGCNFECPGCHNPHTRGICNHCGDCVPACHVDALSVVDGKITFDPTDCDQCDACLDICPINANPMVREYCIDDILDISRIESAKAVIQDDDIDLHAVMNAVSEIVENQAATKGLFFEVHSDPRIPYAVRGDAQYLRQILINPMPSSSRRPEASWRKPSCYRLRTTASCFASR